MNLRSIISSVYTVSENSVQEILPHIEMVEFPKGHILSEEGKAENFLYFLEKGIVRAYSNHKGEEVTFWFGMEGSVVCSMMNYIKNKPSYESLELLEDCRLYQIRTSIIRNLYEQNIDWANWGRKYIELEILKTENRLIEQQFMSATERYQSILKNNPSLIQRVPLGILASYLGITQVSLSRIRAKI